MKFSKALNEWFDLKAQLPGVAHNKHMWNARMAKIKELEAKMDDMIPDTLRDDTYLPPPGCDEYGSID